jgi:leucine-rich repeat protein SHOC2
MAYLGSNQIQVLPAEVGRLAQLKGLDLNDNQIQVLPAEIGSLALLQEFNLRGNPLTFIFDEVLNSANIHIRKNEMVVEYREKLSQLNHAN